MPVGALQAGSSIIPVGVRKPQVTVVGVTEHPEVTAVLVVEQDVEAVPGQESQMFVAVVAEVQPPVVVSVAVASWTLQPKMVAHVERTCVVVVMVALAELETP